MPGVPFRAGLEHVPSPSPKQPKPAAGEERWHPFLTSLLPLPCPSGLQADKSAGVLGSGSWPRRALPPLHLGSPSCCWGARHFHVSSSTPHTRLLPNPHWLRRGQTPHVYAESLGSQKSHLASTSQKGAALLGILVYCTFCNFLKKNFFLIYLKVKITWKGGRGNKSFCLLAPFPHGHQ